MKKIFKLIRTVFLVIIILGVIGMIFGKDDSKSSSSSSTASSPKENQTSEVSDTKEPELEIEYTAYSIGTMMDDLETNALSAKEKYKDQYIEITGVLSVIDSSGKYIGLRRSDDKYAIRTVHCSIKNDTQRQQVLEMVSGDTVTLRGKCTEVGEVMGYTLNIDSIDGFEPKEHEEVETTDGYIICTADQLEEDLQENALKAQNTYKGKMVCVKGRLSTIDSDGKYINIEPINNKYSFTVIQCFIKTDDVKGVVVELQRDDIITIYGKCTDVGEILGYDINIESIER